MKNLKIKALRTFILSLTTTMTLTMTGYGNKAKDLFTKNDDIFTYQDSIEGLETPTILNFENIVDLDVEKIDTNFNIRIGDDAGYFGTHEELTLDTFEQVKKFLSNCVNLQFVSTDGYDIEILEAIPNPENVKTLYCLGQINQLDILEKFTSLYSLHLLNAPIDNIDPISNLKKLRYLEVHNSIIKDLFALQNLTDLENLDFSDNLDLENIEALQNLKNLKFLQLANTKIQNIDVLNDLYKLYLLIITNTDIEDFKALENLINLEFLNLSNTNLKSLYYLRNLTNLTNLDLSLNQLENIAIIKNFYKLESLKLMGNKIPKEHINNLENEKIPVRSIITDMEQKDFETDELKYTPLPNKPILYLTDEQKKEISEGQFINIKAVGMTGYEVEDKCYYIIDIIKDDELSTIRLGNSLNLKTALHLLNSCDTIDQVVLIDIPSEDQEKILNSLPINIKQFKYVGNNVEKVSSSLENQTELEQLIIEGKGTIDVKKIQNSSNLAWLSITVDVIEHTEELTNFENLLFLKMKSENLENADVENIGQIPNIKYIDLRDNENITDYSILTPFSETAIEYLLTKTTENPNAIVTDLLLEYQELAEEIFTAIFYEDLDGLNNCTMKLETLKEKKILIK